MYMYMHIHAYLQTLIAEPGVIEGVAQCGYVHREGGGGEGTVAHYGIKRLQTQLQETRRALYIKISID